MIFWGFVLGVVSLLSLACLLVWLGRVSGLVRDAGDVIELRLRLDGLERKQAAESAESEAKIAALAAQLGMLLRQSGADFSRDNPPPGRDFEDVAGLARADS